MLIVKDLTKLEKYGFHKTVDGQDIYSKELKCEPGDMGQITLTVNPVNVSDKTPNVLIVWYWYEGKIVNPEAVSYELEVLLEMYKDGILEIV